MSSEAGKLLLAQALAAAGGESKLRAIRSIHAEYEFRAEREQLERRGTGSMDQLLSPSPKLRMEEHNGDIDMATIISGDDMFRRIGTDIAEAEDSDWARRRMAGQILAPLFLIDALDRGYRIAGQRGAEKDGIGRTDVLEITDDAGETLTLYLDPSHHRLVASSLAPDAMSYLEDYRSVDGIPVAHHIVQRLPTGAFESTVTKMELNVKLSPQLFER